ncbi:MAG: hypothetical protein U5M51_12515 [Emticicia sp.]|nr:hypothetical protein [Emticicia sp.]
MKNFLLVCSAIFIFSSFRESLFTIEPKSGNISIPAKGENRIWKDVSHSSFRVKITNNNPKQSVELYIVKANGSEKWVSPSLLANSSLTVTIPKDGHLFIKNFNPNDFNIAITH